MTISTEVRRAGPFTGTGAVNTYAFAFKIFATSDVVATETDTADVETVLILNTDYTVSMNADQDNDPGGDVVLSANLTTGYLLTITSDVPELQSVELTNLGGFYPSVLNPLFDKLVVLCQQISEKLGRQITLPVSSTYTDVTIPDPQANYYLQWKEDLTGLKNVAAVSPGALSVSPYIETLLNDADAATARTTLGGVPTLTGIETLTNKTLTTPTLTTPTLTSPVLNGSISGTGISNDTTLAGDSATEIVTEHAVKAYVDNKKQLMSAVYNSSNQSIPNNTQTKLIFPNELYDPLGTHDNVTNNTRITIPTGYTGAIFKFSGAFSAAATGQRRFDLTKNNISDIHGGTISILPASATYIQKQFFESPLLTVTTGDYFEVRAFQDSGGAIDVNGGVNAYGAIFSVELFV